jgi:ABC-2 type transport system permease protein
MSRVAELGASRELLINLTLRELRGKYKRSVLGWSWSLLNPLAMMLIFTMVFRIFLKIGVPKGSPSGLANFAFFLLCGLLPWNFLANGMGGSMGGLIGNANLIKKVYFPREILVVANVASWTVSLVIEMAVLCIALLIAGNFVIPWLLPLLLLIALQSLFVVGVGMTLSVTNVYFRDVQHLIGIVLQLWFYATPIVYPISVVPAHGHVFGAELPVLAIYRLNPMVRFVDAYRACLYDLRFPSGADIAYLVAVTAAVVTLGYLVFGRLEPRLAEEL